MLKASSAKPASIDSYLAKVPPRARASLKALRKVIRAAAPRATERIAYGIPSFYLDDHPLVGFAAFKAHCSFFGMSTAVFAKYAAALKKYPTSAGTVRFPMDQPLPASLVKRVVKARIAENKARFSKRKAAKP